MTRDAGYSNKPIQTASVAIGNKVGYIDQASNNIAINASSNALNPGASRFYVKPINTYGRDSGTTGGLWYDSSTGEIAYTLAKTFVIPHPISKSKYQVLCY